MSNDGGPAFPTPSEYDSHTGEPYVVGFQGLSIRDYFAGQALASLAAAFPGPGIAAARAYELADAMLRERDK